jgi:LysM repeat protein
MDVEMINNMTANGTSAINLQTNVRTYRSRQKQNGRYFKVLLIFLLITFSVYFTKTSISVPEERFVYQPVVVQHGDTLWGLAENTGLHMNTGRLVGKIMVYNSLANSTILPGQTIYIPTLL